MVVWEIKPGGAEVVEPGGAEVVDAVYAATHWGLEVVQSWLARDRAGTLVVLTHGAVGVAGSGVTDLAGAAVWGLIRSAQSEHPGRIVLIDTDTAVDVAALVGIGEPQLAVRAGTTYLARLAPVTGAVLSLPDSATPGIADAGAGLAGGTVLITGGTGMVGGVLARHVVSRYGVRRVVLASRRGEHAEGVAEVVAGLVQAGVEVAVAACDVADRDRWRS